MSSYKTAYIFPGQGSQHPGMGVELFDRHSDLESIAGDILGYSLRELCINDTDRQLNKTQFTQPALFTVNAMTYRTESAKNWNAGDILAGHSLGEYNALHAAGVFDFATGLKLVQKRGEIMSRISGGGMAAVIGLSVQELEELLRKNGLDTVDLANQNSPIQNVISGLEEDIKHAAATFNNVAGCSYIPLKVSGAFHSRYMEGARKEFETFLNDFHFNAPKRVVISNVEARPYEADRIHELLARQITQPVRWTETVQVMMGAGIDQFHEAGPGNILTKLVNTIRQQAPAIAADWPI
jgi:trans-AT polyketide synthase/acyltransferase/oxidoreductase domain-containing protein